MKNKTHQTLGLKSVCKKSEVMYSENLEIYQHQNINKFNLNQFKRWPTRTLNANSVKSVLLKDNAKTPIHNMEPTRGLYMYLLKVHIQF